MQALAACPQFIAWLQLYNNASSDRKSLITSLLNTLEVINGTHSSLRGDPYSPGAVIRALNGLGWVIPKEEHDAHELFHVMLASLEEEAHKPMTLGCLSDALPDTKLDANLLEQPARPSSALLSDFLNVDYDESTNLMRMVRSEAHTPDSPASRGATSPSDPMELDDPLASPLMGRRRPPPKPFGMSQVEQGALNKHVSNSCRSLERLSRGPGRVSVFFSCISSIFLIYY